MGQRFVVRGVTAIFIIAGLAVPLSSSPVAHAAVTRTCSDTSPAAILLFANPLLFKTPLGVPKVTPLYPSCQTVGTFCGNCTVVIKATASSTRGGAGVWAAIEIRGGALGLEWVDPSPVAPPSCRTGTNTTTNQSCTATTSYGLGNAGSVRGACSWREKALVVDHGAKITCTITVTPNIPPG